MIFGSYVEHGVRRIVQGTRISIIFFYKVNTTFDKLLFMWNKKPKQCQYCLKSFSNKYSLGKHFNICTKKISFSRFKDEEDRVNSDAEEKEEALNDITPNKSIKIGATTLDMKTKLMYSKNKQCYKCHKKCRTKRNLKAHRTKCQHEINVSK